MRWRFSLATKVVRRWNDSLAKMVMPKAIHDHSGCQWILSTTHPLSELQAAAFLVFFGQCLTAEDNWRATRNLCSRAFGVTFNLHRDILNLFPFRHGVSKRIR